MHTLAVTILFAVVARVCAEEQKDTDHVHLKLLDRSLPARHLRHADLEETTVAKQRFHLTGRAGQVFGWLTSGNYGQAVDHALGWVAETDGQAQAVGFAVGDPLHGPDTWVVEPTVRQKLLKAKEAAQQAAGEWHGVGVAVGNSSEPARWVVQPTPQPVVKQVARVGVILRNGTDKKGLEKAVMNLGNTAGLYAGSAAAWVAGDRVAPAIATMTKEAVGGFIPLPYVGSAAGWIVGTHVRSKLVHAGSSIGKPVGRMAGLTIGKSVNVLRGFIPKSRDDSLSQNPLTFWNLPALAGMSALMTFGVALSLRLFRKPLLTADEQH
eukprot:gnl/TRDRNA2_/TRDRNA2_196531_c0_seq1.p1 gnl/TRDRNA2_/TRDRNA2_196531_c0~~gnl/TRDRNA2_/TRDRNA2_196531_c0_seq1.p1  ORF type:complete len:323 (+),score=32.91 gnl/TRDRNA2_/TRDRNA2_196531_c0_seq1:113-1081(+)